jgi:hypothetical protein
VPLDTTGMFMAKFVKVGDDVFIGGQPTEKALRDLRAQGVTTVVNFRTPEEMTRSVKFDEAALVQCQPGLRSAEGERALYGDDAAPRRTHLPTRNSGQVADQDAATLT